MSAAAAQLSACGRFQAPGGPRGRLFPRAGSSVSPGGFWDWLLLPQPAIAEGGAVPGFPLVLLEHLEESPEKKPAGA